MLFTIFTVLALALSVAGYHDGVHSRPRMVHQNIAKRVPGNVWVYKRYSSTRWSFYDVGLGACGKVNVGSDFIVALNSQQFGPGYPGAHCFKTITMTYQRKTATATIMDSCPGCPYGGLDLSRGLFKYFASEDVGIISGDWSFVDGAQAATTTTRQVTAAVTTSTSKATPTTTSTTLAVPTTTWKPMTTTPTLKATPATTSTSLAAPPTTTGATPKADPTTSSTSTRKVVSTASWSPEVIVNITTAPSSTATATNNAHTTSVFVSTKAKYSSSMAAAKSNVANIASSFSSFRPSPSAVVAAAANSTNTTTLIEDHFEVIEILLQNLEKLMKSAGIGQDQA